MPNLCDLPVGLLRQILQHYVESDTIRMRPDQFPENGHTIVHQLYDAMRVNKLWYDILDEDMWAPDFLPPMIGPKQSRWKSRRTGYLYGTLAEHVTDKIDEHERQRIRLKEEHEAKTRLPQRSQESRSTTYQQNSSAKSSTNISTSSYHVSTPNTHAQTIDARRRVHSSTLWWLARHGARSCRSTCGDSSTSRSCGASNLGRWLWSWELRIGTRVRKWFWRAGRTMGHMSQIARYTEEAEIEVNVADAVMYGRHEAGEFGREMIRRHFR